jgi:hypothetical protein
MSLQQTEPTLQLGFVFIKATCELIEEDHQVGLHDTVGTSTAVCQGDGAKEKKQNNRAEGRIAEV